MQYKNPGKIEFRAKLKDAGAGGAYVKFPHDIEELFGAKSRVPVKATFDGESYSGSIVNMGDGPIIGVLKSIREKIHKQHGDKIYVGVELDDAPRVVKIPDDLQAELEKHPCAKEKFKKLAYSHQKEYAEYVTSAKKQETRTNRIDKIIARLTE